MTKYEKEQKRIAEIRAYARKASRIFSKPKAPCIPAFEVEA